MKDADVATVEAVAVAETDVAAVVDSVETDYSAVEIAVVSG
ncbi:MAG: hypothetical protein ACI4ON_03570 [Clostridia bacterium]